jgi:hypothetical protein
VHVSVPLQNKLSVHAEPLGSFAEQLSAASEQDSTQLPSPSAPGHGLPVCPLHTPPEHVSEPLQNRESLHAEPFGSLPVQVSDASLHVSAQLPSPSGPGHGFAPASAQTPFKHASGPLQKKPSVQAEPFGSLDVQAATDSLQESAQLPLVGWTPGHGLTLLPSQTPRKHASAPLQKIPSLQVAVLKSSKTQSPPPSQTLSEQRS